MPVHLLHRSTENLTADLHTHLTENQYAQHAQINGNIIQMAMT